MNLFYTNLWDKNLSPVESLRRAQLEVYRNPGQDRAKSAEGLFRDVRAGARRGPADLEIKPTKDGKAHPVYWAAFTLSGPGQ